MVPRAGRNDPCPCGSGRKAKRCCEIARGPSEEQLARAFVAQRARQAGVMLASLEPEEVAGYLDQLIDLPGRDLSLIAPLPRITSPECARLFGAIEDDDPEAIEMALPAVLATIDTPPLRARLARAIEDLERAGRIGPRQAAVALVDLYRRHSLLVTASVMRAGLVCAGARPTPSGLLVA